MDLVIAPFRTPQENILFDQVLFERADQGLGNDVLRFWESAQTFIVLGKTSDAQKESIIENLKRDRIPVLRRVSAGGVVVQSKGCLNFTLVLSKARYPLLATIPSSYEFILSNILLALKALGIEGRFFPPCDLALGSDRRKFSGNAQRRGKRVILHHGTLLHHFDISLAEKYLAAPLKAPAYRQGRAHKDFMANINRDPQKIIQAISDIFKAPRSSRQPDPQELAALDSLLARSQD